MELPARLAAMHPPARTATVVPLPTVVQRVVAREPAEQERADALPVEPVGGPPAVPAVREQVAARSERRASGSAAAAPNCSLP